MASLLTVATAPGIVAGMIDLRTAWMRRCSIGLAKHATLMEGARLV